MSFTTIVSAADLQAHRDDAGWCVFDCRHDLVDHSRGARVYGEGHIGGAFFVAVEEVVAGTKTGRNGRHPLPDLNAFAAFLARHGVDDATQVVACDDSGGQYAARFWWLARAIGLQNVAVLDGGVPAFVAAGFALETAAPPPRTPSSLTARVDASRWVTVDDVVAISRGGRGLIVDARAPERFRGESEPIDAVAGHIPTAQNRFFKTNLNADLTMRPAAALRAEFDAVRGAVAITDVIHQCGSGVTACVNLLAMEHAGLHGSRLYVGSWSEWIADRSRAVATGP